MSFGIAAAIIGGGLGLMGSMNQADAVSQAGQDTRAASDAAVRSQESMFNTQQANSNLKYNQIRGDLSSLFGGNVNQNLTGANAGAGISGGGMTAESLRALLLPQFTSQSTAANMPNPSDYDGAYNYQLAVQLAQKINGGAAGGVDEAGLNAAIQQILAQQGGAGGGASGIAPGSIFGPDVMNNPQLQQVLQQLQAGGVQLGNTAGSLNPLMSQFGNTASSQLQQFNSFNPQTMAQDIYSKLALLGKPQREIDRANLESRLLNQGILTSSPGFSQINSMDQANSQQDLAREIQSMLTAQSTQQQMLANAQGAAGTMGSLAGQQGNLITQQGNLATAGANVKNAAIQPMIQAIGIEAGVPVNSAQPIPTGALSVAGAQAQGQANVNAANITNSFWSSLGSNSGFQQGLTGLLGNLGGGLNLPTSGGGSPINTAGQNLGGADGLFALINGYGGGV
jgi:hypothetical protein